MEDHEVRLELLKLIIHIATKVEMNNPELIIEKSKLFEEYVGVASKPQRAQNRKSRSKDDNSKPDPFR